MKKILITGGTGTVGKSFIERYYNDYVFHTISRNEKFITDLKRSFPNVNCHVGTVCDLDHMVNLFCDIKPDIVIHAAALKHINLAEENPSSAVEINITGSLNIIKASIRASVPLTVGISTDKACAPTSIYGYTKSIMESLFMQHSNNTTKFVCTRFANVAHSNGSVIPFWISETAKGKKLKLTDPGMNRLMFSKKECAETIQMAISSSTVIKCPFILCKLMKSVNLLELSNLISDKGVEIIGKRPGEKLNETLISEKELPYTSKDIPQIISTNYLSNERVGYVIISPNKQKNNLIEEYSSSNASMMTEQEMKEIIACPDEV